MDFERIECKLDHDLIYPGNSIPRNGFAWLVRKNCPGKSIPRYGIAWSYEN